MMIEGIFIINNNLRIELRCYSMTDFLDLKPKNDSTSLIISYFSLLRIRIYFYNLYNLQFSIINLINFKCPTSRTKNRRSRK